MLACANLRLPVKGRLGSRGSEIGRRCPGGSWVASGRQRRRLKATTVSQKRLRKRSSGTRRQGWPATHQRKRSASQQASNGLTGFWQRCTRGCEEGPKATAVQIRLPSRTHPCGAGKTLAPTNRASHAPRRARHSCLLPMCAGILSDGSCGRRGCQRAGGD